MTTTHTTYVNGKAFMPYFVNRPKGDVQADDFKPSDVLYCRGFRVEPKVGCCDNGHRTKEERVVVLYDAATERGFLPTVINRHGYEYGRRISAETLDQLLPLVKKGYRMFDCGYFPQGERAGDMVLYGLPRHPDGYRGEMPHTYLEMRKIMEAHYPISLDERLLRAFEVEMENRPQLCLAGKRMTPTQLGDYSLGMVTIPQRRNDPEFVKEQRRQPYRHIISSPQVYILPSWEAGPHLDIIWAAMKKHPETTYEGMVIKQEHRPQVYTNTQKDNSSWIKIRWR